jgi:hypothetical protein
VILIEIKNNMAEHHFENLSREVLSDERRKIAYYKQLQWKALPPEAQARIIKQRREEYQRELARSKKSVPVPTEIRSKEDIAKKREATNFINALINKLGINEDAGFEVFNKTYPKQIGEKYGKPIMEHKPVIYSDNVFIYEEFCSNLPEIIAICEQNKYLKMLSALKDYFVSRRSDGEVAYIDSIIHRIKTDENAILKAEENAKAKRLANESAGAGGAGAGAGNAGAGTGAGGAGAGNAESRKQFIGMIQEVIKNMKAGGDRAKASLLETKLNELKEGKIAVFPQSLLSKALIKKITGAGLVHFISTSGGRSRRHRRHHSRRHHSRRRHSRRHSRR